MKSQTREEVLSHNKESDALIIIDEQVQDISKFILLHPGGREVLLPYLGKDATQIFYSLHRTDVLFKYTQLVVGQVESDSKLEKTDGTIKSTPFSEQNQVFGQASPQQNESHLDFQGNVRKQMAENILGEAESCEESGKPPSAGAFLKLGEGGILLSKLGPGTHLKYQSEKSGIKLPGNLHPDKFCYFHEFIVHFEQGYISTPGYTDGLMAGFTIGIPLVLNQFNSDLKDKVVLETIKGHKKICLAISEAFAGSDVLSMLTRAEKSDCGNFQQLIGTKKWISSGMWCDQFVTAARTGPNKKDISLFLVEKSENLKLKLIKTAQSTSSGTAQIEYDRVKIPKEHLMGEENDGFKILMFNFNHERWAIMAGVLGGCRRVIDECWKWAALRRVFGKPLVEQPVIRAKLANISAALEAVAHWVDNITHNMNQMEFMSSQVMLGGVIALAKMHVTKVSALVVNEACQIFGGRAITRTGMGRQIERLQRSYKYGAIQGGSEEIMAELGIKMALKMMPSQAKL